MKKIILLTIFQLLTLLFLTNAQEWNWARKAGYYAFDYGYGICADAKGNVYVSGKYEMDAYFDKQTMVSNKGNHDIFTAKYNQFGKLLWVKTAGSEWGDYALANTCDDNGNVYVTGEFEMTTVFDESGVSLNTWGGNDMFLAKYNTEGKLLWARRAGGKGSDRGYSVTLHGNAVYVAGSFKDTAWFDNVKIVSAGDHDTYLAKYDIYGNFIWVKRGGGPGEDRSYSVTTDKDGKIYITGFYDDQAEFNGTTYFSNGTKDIFLAKYDENGNFLWFKTAGGLRNDLGTSVKAGNDGRIYVTGGFREQSYFGNIEMWAKLGDTDIFTACYTRDGDIVWVRKAGGDINDLGQAITLDDSTNVYVTGYFGFNAEFGPVSLTAADSADIFVVKYDKNGIIKWVMKADGQKDSPYQMGTEESGRSLWMDRKGNLLLSGSIRKDAIFGEDHLEGWMHTDIFVAKIKQSLSGDFPVSIVSHNDIENNIEVFPNPSNGLLHVIFTGSTESEIKVKIHSIGGQLIYEKEYTSSPQQQEKIQIKNIAEGLYFLEILFGEERVVKKLIIH